MGKSEIAIEPLDLENYTSWAVQMKALLILKKAWKAVTEHNMDADVNETALSLLLLNVKSHHYPFITAATTAKEAWNALLGAYKAQSLARKQLLRKKLSNLKKAPKEPISKYYSQACQIRDDMIAVGVCDKEIDLVGALLSGLPTEYALLVEVLEMHAMDMKPDDVYTRLLRHEQKLNESSSPDTDGAALYMAQGASSSAKTPPSGQHQAGSSSSGAAKKTCHYCHKLGHIKKNCFKFKADQRKKNGQGGSAASAYPAVSGKGSNLELSQRQTQEFLTLSLHPRQHDGQTQHYHLDHSSSVDPP